MLLTWERFFIVGDHSNPTGLDYTSRNQCCHLNEPMSCSFWQCEKIEAGLNFGRIAVLLIFANCTFIWLWGKQHITSTFIYNRKYKYELFHIYFTWFHCNIYSMTKWAAHIYSREYFPLGIRRNYARPGQWKFSCPGRESNSRSSKF